MYDARNVCWSNRAQPRSDVITVLCVAWVHNCKLTIVNVPLRGLNGAQLPIVQPTSGTISAGVAAQTSGFIRRISS
jgi:hypothetical protein